MSVLDELRETFRQEAIELLNELAKILEGLRNRNADASALVAARRVAHNLKGAAITVGAQRIAGPCHALEDEFEIAAKTKEVPTADQVESWLFLVTELQAATDDPNIVAICFSEAPASKSQVGIPASVSPTAPMSKAASPAECPQQADIKSASTAGTATGTTAAVPVGAQSTPTIRVETRRLDEMMAHVREVAQIQVLLASQARALQESCDEVSVASTGESATNDRSLELRAAVRQMYQDTQEFGHLVDVLSISINRVRLTPLSSMSPLWLRAVREAANRLGRPAQLEIEVGEAEVDIHLSELIKDPLLHILRNAVAHGIEPAEVRQGLGKPQVGRIRIEARADGSFVELRISDDGKGIDPKRIAQKAVERGWITMATADSMSDAERRALVFLPGFSTADVVTTIAGRGMGLHSVQRNLEELGGSVSVSAEADLGGTTFRLRIPASVLGVKGLLVRSGDVVYALPLYDVAQVAAVALSDLEQSEGQPIYRDAAGRPIRVRSLDELLGRPSGTAMAQLFLVVLRRTGQDLALIVDSVIGEREFVIRPMPWNLATIPGINGALILPDGTVALSLDSTVLLAAAQRRRVHTSRTSAQQGAARRKILVVDDSLAVRTLESQTLGAAGYDVTVCVDGMEAWQLLQKREFDLLISDVQMPNLDGFELTARIRASEPLQHLPVILVTSLSSPNEVARGAQVGADSYITKGDLDQEKLLLAVRRLID